MKKIIFLTFIITASLTFKVSAQNPVVAPPQKKPVMLTGGTVHTGNGPVIEDGTVAFSSGKITFVGKTSEFNLDKTGYEIIDVSGKQESGSMWWIWLIVVIVLFCIWRFRKYWRRALRNLLSNY